MLHAYKSFGVHLFGRELSGVIFDSDHGIKLGTSKGPQNPETATSCSTYVFPNLPTQQQQLGTGLTICASNSATPSAPQAAAHCMPATCSPRTSCTPPARHRPHPRLLLCILRQNANQRA